MEILENIGYIANLVNRYEPLFDAGLLTEAAVDDVSGLDASLSDLDKQVDSLQASIDVYIEIFNGLKQKDPLGGSDNESHTAAATCSDTLVNVREDLDNIAQLDMGAISSIGDFFGKDSSYKKGLEELNAISQEMSKVHSIAAGSAAAIARLMKRAKNVKEGEEYGNSEHGLVDANNGFFAKNGLEFKDVLKQVKRSAKAMLPGVFKKMGGFFSGIVGGKKSKPLFGLSADLIARAIAGVQGKQFNNVGQKMVALGNDISKFGESLAKYKEKEKELKKATIADRKEKKAADNAVSDILNKNLAGENKKQTYIDRRDRAAGFGSSEEQSNDIVATINSFSQDFKNMVAEANNLNTVNMNLDFLSELAEADEDLLDEEEPDGNAEVGFNSDELADLRTKLVNRLIDDVEDLDIDVAEKIADAMVESNVRKSSKGFFRSLVLAGLKG